MDRQEIIVFMLIAVIFLGFASQLIPVKKFKFSIKIIHFSAVSGLISGIILAPIVYYGALEEYSSLILGISIIVFFFCFFCYFVIKEIGRKNNIFADPPQRKDFIESGMDHKNNRSIID